MNCDDVFEVLTRGPFPNGSAEDAQVEAHLADCPECSQLAEALRPAVALFQESLDWRERHSLPGIWDELPRSGGGPVALSQRTKAKVWPFAQKSERFAPPAWVPRLLIVVATLLVGVFLWTTFDAGLSNRATNAAQLYTQCVRTAMQAPVDWPLEMDALLVQQLKSDNILCCTDCHRRPALHLRPLSALEQHRLASACSSCHAQPE